jgi:hypothetical protein
VSDFGVESVSTGVDGTIEELVWVGEIVLIEKSILVGVS